MQKSNNNKGITLIALIITIIVMLILVGVTVNIAINGDLFGTASKAGLETQKAAEQEELSMAALSAINDEALEVGYIDVNVLEAKINELETEYIKDTTKTTDYNYVVTSSKTGTTWQISLITAKVTEYNEGGNPWLERGLTSSDVLFDTTYVYDYGQGELEFVVYSNGGINFFGDVSPSNIVQPYYEAGEFVISSNSISIPSDSISLVFGYDETLGNTMVTTGIAGNVPLTFTVRRGIESLVGLTFECPVLNLTPANIAARGESYDPSLYSGVSMTFGESTLTMQANGTTYNGTYTYDPITSEVSITVTMDGEEKTAPTAKVYTIKESGTVINNYFIISGNNYGNNGIYTTNGNSRTNNSIYWYI